MYLNRLAQILAAPRDPKQMAEDKKLLREKMQDKEQEKDKRREKDFNKKSQEDKIKSLLKEGQAPSLLVIHPIKGDGENYKKAQKEFENDLKTSVPLISNGEVFALLIGKRQNSYVKQLAAFNIANKKYQLPEDLLKIKDPFTDIKIDLDDVDQETVKADLQSAWAKAAPSSQLEKSSKEKKFENRVNPAESLKIIKQIKDPSVIIIDRGEGSGWKEHGDDFLVEMQDEIDKCAILAASTEFIALMGDNADISVISNQIERTITHAPTDFKEIWTADKTLEENPFATSSINLGSSGDDTGAVSFSPKKIRSVLIKAWSSIYEEWKKESTDTAKDKKPKSKKHKEGSILAKISKFASPRLLIVTVPKEKAEAYDKIVSELDPNTNHVNLANTETLKGWLVDAEGDKEFKQKLDAAEIEKQEEKFVKKTETKEGEDDSPLKLAANFLVLAEDLMSGKELVDHDEPFKDISLDNDLRTALQTEWSKERKTVEEDEDEDGVDDVAKRKAASDLSRIRQLPKLHILVLNPIQDVANYEKAMASPHPEIDKCIHFAESKRFKDGNSGVDLFFLAGDRVAKVEDEVKRLKIKYSLMPAKEDFHEDTLPFTGMALNEKTFGKIDIKTYANELNTTWSHLDDDSGPKIPAVEISNNVPVSFARFLDRKQRPIKMYIGDQPSGSGNPDGMYLLITDMAEGEQFVKTLIALNMPSLFYTGIYPSPDIDRGFKRIDPEVFKASNALILEAKSTFDPSRVIPIDQIDPELLKVAAKGIDTEEIDKINIRLEQLEKEADLAVIHSEGKDKKEKIAEEIQKLNEQLHKEAKNAKLTELHLLHAYAKAVLGNPARQSGAYVAGKYIIGTHIANFSKDFKLCILWGSNSKHVSIDTAELLKQMPFVKKANTSYL